MLVRVRLHADQLDLPTATVVSLLTRQFPRLAGLPIRPVTSHGTVNLLFRLGEDLVLRFPMQAGDVDVRRAELEGEARNARLLRGRLPVATPQPVAIGQPGPGYPLPWAIYGWLPGTVATNAAVEDSTDFAHDLAGVVRSLRAMDAGGATFDGAGRGGLLPSMDETVAVSLERGHGLIDVDAVAGLWSDLRQTPRHDEPDVWTHGDLMPGNLLTRDGRLSAVIDVDNLGPADPALDLMPAWNLLQGDARHAFREGVGGSDAMWARGRGWALAQAVAALYYYRETNPVMFRTAHRTLTALLDDAA